MTKRGEFGLRVYTFSEYVPDEEGFEDIVVSRSLSDAMIAWREAREIDECRVSRYHRSLFELRIDVPKSWSADMGGWWSVYIEPFQINAVY